MTILPNCAKKKSTQGSSNGDIEAGENSKNSNHLQNHQHQLPNLSSIPNHIPTNGENNNLGSLFLNSQSSQPWPSGSTSSQRDENKRVSHSSPLPYEDNIEPGSSHTKRRYRASPLRSVRPKLREHRGNTSPSYPNVAHHSHQLSLSTSPNLPVLPSLHSPQAGPSCSQESDNDPTAYNSGDEYESFGAWNLTKEQWEEKERWFEKKMKKKHRIIKKMGEDGACLFRAIADQVFGDQDMQAEVRKQCMDYLERNEETFHPFVSENYDTYIERKRKSDCFGNHIEIAAMSEMYNRIIEVYCYSTDPINIFQGSLQTDNAPIRLTYHRGTHYNSLVDPYQATVGVGLGLPGYQPGLADKNLMNEATHQSEQLHIEKAMLEDKIRATDYEATSEAIEKHVAHQSYIDWLRDNETRVKNSGSSGSEVKPCTKDRLSPRPPSEPVKDETRTSPRDTHRCSPRRSPRNIGSPNTTGTECPPQASGSVDLAIPGSSKDPMPSSSSKNVQFDGFTVNQRASFLDHLPPDMFGLSDYENEEATILAQVLAASQQEYLDSLKNRKDELPNSPDNS